MSLSLWCEEGSANCRGPPLRAPWDSSISRERVMEQLLQAERRYLPSACYVSLVQRHPHQREELLRWTLEVCCECACDEPVFPLAASLLDRFLSISLALKGAPLCLAAACVLIASKLLESETVSAQSLCTAASGSFLPSTLQDMERLILATLRWDVAAITPQDFIPHLLPAPGHAAGGPEDTGEFQTTLRRHGDTLVAMCVCDSRFLGKPPSLVAAAALSSALRGLGCRGPELEQMMGMLAALCQMQLSELQYHTELIEDALLERLTEGQRPKERKEQDMYEERARTPTDLTEIDF
ncbi:G1/S-specific cyclin-D2-like [Arapaima gigas]